MNIVTIVILVVLLGGMLIMPYFTQKKRNQEYMNMLSSIKVGDIVKTAGGIIGKINKISDKGEVRTIVLETGSKTEKSYLEMDMSMIYQVLNKTTKPAETKTEEPKEQPETEEIAEQKEEAKAEESKTTKSAEKKTAAKKTTAKKTATKKASSKK